MKSQKEVTLREDLSLEDRQGIYRTFFVYCMTGHVTVLPMGATSEHLAWSCLSGMQLWLSNHSTGLQQQTWLDQPFGSAGCACTHG